MRRFWFLALAACLAGCGSANGLNLGKVHGKITYKGQPVTGGTILFEPDVSKGTSGPPAVGSIATDGSFALSTEESGDGAIVGFHKVAITGIDPKPLSGSEKDLESMSGQEIMALKSQHGQKKARKNKEDEGPTIRAKDGSTYRVITPEKLLDPKTSDLAIKVTKSPSTRNISILESGAVEIE
jgi:hypothetical protein